MSNQEETEVEEVELVEVQPYMIAEGTCDYDNIYHGDCRDTHHDHLAGERVTDVNSD